MPFYLCWPHKVHAVGEKMKENEDFHGLLKVLFASAAIIQGPHNVARCQRWLRFLETKGVPVTFPPDLCDTLWSSYRNHAEWYQEHFVLCKEFITPK
mmetsp:Transcript_121517/g.211151  ORF Transcript_121517/g.211151 Transcript_121517/m.211151 type:complete len:97 (-) Transcript_121517:263-553(-)